MKKLLILAVLLLFAGATFAQQGAVKGFVYEKGSEEPLPFATVAVEGTTIGSKSNNSGFFNIPKLPVGTITLRVSSVGYETTNKTIEIKANFTKSTKIFLKKRPRTFKKVVITRKKVEKKFETGVALTKITPKELKLLPSIGGEPDIAQYLSVMPGVVSTGDQGGQLYIRGGSPIQNKILLDGMTIYNPFHSIGLYSVFETEAIRNAEVMSGGFGVEYGDRTSAIVNVTTKDGNKNKVKGKIGVNPILAKAFLEGPLSKPKEEGGGSVTFLASVKHSYLRQSSSALYGGLGEPYATKLPYNFTDVYGKINLNAASGGKFSFFGFNFDDKVNFQGTSDLNWKNYGMGTNFVISPSGASSLISGGLYFSDYKINLEEADNRPRSSNINGFDANISVTSYLQNHNELKYGVEFNGFKTVYNYFNFLGLPLDQSQYTTQLGVYVKGKKNFGDKLIIEPGIRLQYYASIPATRLEPRMAFKYNISDNVRLKGSAGLYSQNLISSKSDRDIVNFFTGFLTAPSFQVADRQGKNVNNNVQKAYHIIGGIEVDKGNFEFTLEPWFKNFTQLLTINRYKLEPGDSDFLIETGKAYGIDFTTKYTKNRIYFWGVYSYGYVDRFDGEQRYPTPFDRRHNVNLLLSYTAGEKDDWTFSARFNYGSAFPFTQTQSFFEQMDFSSGLSTNYLTQNGNLGILYADDINGGRLSAYHRLDISAAKKFELKNKSVIEFNASLTNAYNQRNIFYIDRIRNTREYQLPLFPSVGLNWSF
jgi:hypothetical protein